MRRRILVELARTQVELVGRCALARGRRRGRNTRTTSSRNERTSKSRQHLAGERFERAVMAPHHDTLTVRDDAELLQRTRHLRQRALEQPDRARDVAQAHLALQERLRRAERDQIREACTRGARAGGRRRHDARAIERAQARRRDLEQAVEISPRVKKIG